MITDTYVFAKSPLHSASPGFKLLALLVFCTLLFIFEGWWTLLPGLALVAIAFWIARLAPRLAWQAIRPVMPILVAIFLVQLYFANIELAVFVTLRFITLILAASLVTMTTKTSEFVEAIMAALKHAPSWVPRRQIALAFALTFRFIPRIRGHVADIRTAQAARGLDRNIRALIVPLILRTLRDADDIANAIDARSVD